MKRWWIGLLIVAGLLVATNPSRADFNSWAQSYAAEKIAEEARARGEDPDDGASQFGGALAGLLISHMPVERQNFLAFSAFRIKVPDANGEAKACRVLGIAGQFLLLGGC